MAQLAPQRPLSIAEAVKALEPGRAKFRRPTPVRPPTKTIPVHVFGRKRVEPVPTEPVTPSIPPDAPVSVVPKRSRAATRGPVAAELRTSGVDPGIVFWGESRKTFADRSYPWCAIGRVDTPVGFGTGCLVGPRHLLTASHVIKWLPDNRAGHVQFRPGFNRDLADADSKEACADVFATSVTTFRKIDVGFPPAIEYGQVSADMALCILDRRIGDELGWLGTRMYDDDWDDEALWQNVGYPSCEFKSPGCIGDGMRPMYDFGAPFKALQSEDYGLGTIIRCEGDMTPGHSGGPVFAFWPEGPYSIGVYSSSGTIEDISDDQGNFLAGGKLLVQLVRKMRNDFP